MAHLWQLQGEDRWTATELCDNAYILTADGTSPVHRRAGLQDRGEAVLVRHTARKDDDETWVLQAPKCTAVCLNGRPLYLGVRVLRNRDEILVRGVVRLFYSTERRPVVVEFPGADRPVFCARCKQPIPPGTPAVNCPKCHTWHCQTDELPCWTYAPTCALCDQPTVLEAEYSWSPEAL